VQVVEVVEEYDDVEGAKNSVQSGLLQDPEAALTSQAADEAGASDVDAQQVVPDTGPPGKITRVVLRTVEPPLPPRQVQIGRIARENLLHGEVLSNEYLVELVVEAARAIQADYERASPSSADTSDAPRRSAAASSSQVCIFSCQDKCTRRCCMM
jgi:hypothetical protein